MKYKDCVDIKMNMMKTNQCVFGHGLPSLLQMDASTCQASLAEVDVHNTYQASCSENLSWDIEWNIEGSMNETMSSK